MTVTPVNFQQYHGDISTFYNRSSKYTFVRYSYKFNNVLMCLLLRIFSCLAFYVVIFIKALKNCTRYILKGSIISLHLLISYSLLTQLLIYSHRISFSGDIELNPGAKQEINQCFLMSHCNSNSIASHSFSKIQSSSAYTCIHKFGIICLSECYFNSEILSSDSNLQISGYNFTRVDHPSNTKRGCVCLYYKCSLPLKVIDISYLQEHINFEVKVGDKTCNLDSLYRSPSQAKDVFEYFIQNLELKLKHIANISASKSTFLILVLGDFNLRMLGWYQNDITAFEGSKIDMVTSQLKFEPNNERTNTYFEQFGFLHRLNFYIST